MILLQAHHESLAMNWLADVSIVICRSSYEAVFLLGFCRPHPRCAKSQESQQQACQASGALLSSSVSSFSFGGGLCQSCPRWHEDYQHHSTEYQKYRCSHNFRIVATTCICGFHQYRHRIIIEISITMNVIVTIVIPALF